jgi:hypothetical protein
MISSPRQRKPDDKSEDLPALWSFVKILQNFSIYDVDVSRARKKGEATAYILLDHPFTCKDGALGEEWMQNIFADLVILIFDEGDGGTVAP